MAGSHLRGERRGPGRRLVIVVLVALLVGLAFGGGVTLVVMGDGDGTSVGTDAGASGPDDGSSENPSSDDASSGDAAADPAPQETEDPGPITIAFAGDINVELSLADRLASDPDGFVGPFAELLRGADLAIGNLEAAVTDGDTALDKEFTFRAPSSVLDALAAGGFDVISLANNHSLDHGPEGLEETLGHKASRSDDLLVGIGADEDEAFAPHIAEVGGQRVAVIAATQELDAGLVDAWTATRDQGGVASARRVDRLIAEVEAARAAADTVVVFAHWGTEAKACPNADQEELARSLTDAGADLVVGTNAHWLQGAGRLGSGFVGYGLGNFLFGAVSPQTEQTGVLLVEVDGREVLGYEWRPGRIDERVPIPLEGDEATAATDEWNSLRDCTELDD